MEVLIGCQISIAQGLEKALGQALDIGAQGFQFFTRNPRGSSAREIGQEEINHFSLAISKLRPFPLIAHLPYTVNMMSASVDTRQFAAEIVASDIWRMRHVGADALVVHPGSRLTQRRDEALRHLVTLLERHVLPQLGEIWFLLETMSGSGSEMGSIEDIGEVINRLGRPAHLGVCLDTCHLFAAGYDLRHQPEIQRLLQDVDRHIGLGRVRCVHINDSKFGPGMRKDRHEKVGEGLIGQAGLVNVMAIDAFSHLPFILETPVDEPKDYALEIARLHSWLDAR